MKRARNEHMQALVLSYLKKRNYADSEASFKLDFKFEETLRDMTTRASEEIDLSTSNTAAIAVFNIDEYFTAFEEFLKFCDDAANEHSQLIDLVYPMFCHMYLDLVMASRKADAGTFFRHFEVQITKKCQAANPPLLKLAQAIQPADVESCNEINKFRKKKSTVDLPAEAHALLLRFLYTNSCLVLLKILNLHIFINISDGKNLFDLFENGAPARTFRRVSETERVVKKEKQTSEHTKANGTENVVAPAPEPVTLSAPSMMSPPIPMFTPVEPAQTLMPDIDLKTLKSSFQKVYDSKPSIANICAHRLHDVASTGLTHAAFSNSFVSISTGAEDSTAKIWSIAECNVSKKGNALSKSDENYSGRLSPDVSKVHLGCDFFENVKAKLKVDGSNLTRCLRAHSGTVCCSCFSHDDRFLLTSSEDTTVRLWDLSSCKNKAIYRGHNHPVWCVAMSNRSLYFATGSMDRTARLWTTERTYPLRTFAGHYGDVECVAFHGNMSYLATADKTVRLWDVTSGKTVRLMIGHWAAVLCVAFSPNGKFLASSGEDGKIRMWDIASGSLIKEMRGHDGAVYSLDFSPDGSMLASGGADSCLRVWNTRTSQAASTKSNTDVNDPQLNPDFVGRWNLPNCTLHAVKFESCNLLHCVAATGNR